MPSDPLEALRAALSDRYRVERQLGSGGMATVYLAHDLRHDRPVAIKVLREELSAVLGRERFLREIQIAARLTHPHILTVHDSGDAAGHLYYVMPYVEGESLQERLAREKQLPVEEAVRIVREVARALGYAHAHGVIHRDIKPGNILLSGGQTFVADFGLARALTRARSRDAITQSGLTIGTPAYMSPEQASGDRELDGRSDIYALACVLYEMLAGDPPFTASNPNAVLARHAAATPVPVRTVRSSVPSSVDRALRRALQKAPADRFGDAEAFAAALEEQESERASRLRSLNRWRAAGITLAAGIVVWLVARSLGPGGPGSGGPAGLDTSRIAVLPPAGLDLASATSRDVAQLLHDAFARWAGVSMVDRFQVADAITRRGGDALLPADAPALARELGAGRFVRSEVVASGDSLRLRAGLFDVGRSAALLESGESFRNDLRGADVAVARLADRLLLRGVAAASAPGGAYGTSSLPALQAYARGQAAIKEWGLESADSAFSEALRYDAGYSQAALWLAQVRMWNNAPEPRWGPLAEQALVARERLPSAEQPLADGVAALARKDYASACTTYRAATRSDPNRFAAWFGLATCVRKDVAVIRDAGSASRWRFRSSYEEAVKAYRAAFLLLPSMHVAFRANGFQRIRGLLYTANTDVMIGHALPPDSLTFGAYPGWRGDSLVFVPYPLGDFSRGLPEARATQQEAVLRQRRRFHEIAVAWAGFFPDKADALEALALSLELLGDPSALDTLRRARRAARDPGERQRVAGSEVWLRLKLALPDNLPDLQGVRALADSVLARMDHPDAPDPALLARLAALRGRAFLAADLGGRAAARGSLTVPRPLAREGPAFWAYAALGGPRDSLERLDKAVYAIIESSMVPGAEQAEARRDWLSRPASLAYPEARLESLGRLPAGPATVAHAQLAAGKEEWGEVRRVLDAIRNRRRDVLPEDRTFDRLYPEADLFKTMGDAQGAAAWLDPTLGAIHRLSPQALIDVPNVGALVRSMALRAELGERLGDPTAAKRWATAVTILWDGADPFLEPVLRRMRQLAR